MPTKRTRSRGLPTSVTGNWTQTAYTSNYPTATTSTTTGTSSNGPDAKNGYTEVCVDTVTPAFRRISMAGGVVNGEFEKTLTTYTAYSSGSILLTRTNSTNWSAGNIKTKSWTGATYYGISTSFFPTLTPAVDIEAAKVLAGTQAMSQVDAPEVQGLVDLAELEATLRMLKQPMSSLVDLSRQLRRTANRRMWADRKKNGQKKTGSLQFSEAMAGAWLEVRYGWTPLLGTVQGLLEILATEKKGSRKTARGTSFVPPRSGSSTQTQSGWPYAGCSKCVKTQNATATYKVRAGVMYESTTSLQNQLGLNLQEVPSAMWELIPFSFVVDWFVNVGDWLRAVTPRTGVKELASWTTYEYVHRVNYQEVSSPSGTVNDYVCSGTSTFSATWERRYKSRVPSVSIGVVSKFGEITLSRPKDLKHLADAVALIVGNLSATGARL